MSAPQPCPECSNGKCINCTGTTMTDDEVHECPCREAGHGDPGCTELSCPVHGPANRAKCEATR